MNRSSESVWFQSQLSTLHVSFSNLLRFGCQLWTPSWNVFSNPRLFLAGVANPLWASLCVVPFILRHLCPQTIPVLHIRLSSPDGHGRKATSHLGQGLFYLSQSGSWGGVRSRNVNPLKPAGDQTSHHVTSRSGVDWPLVSKVRDKVYFSNVQVGPSWFVGAQHLHCFLSRKSAFISH